VCKPPRRSVVEPGERSEPVSKPPQPGHPPQPRSSSLSTSGAPVVLGCQNPAMRFRHELSYDAPPEQVFEMLADPDFRRRSCEAMEVISADVELERDLRR
jgi:hypothetical protein